MQENEKELQGTTVFSQAKKAPITEFIEKVSLKKTTHGYEWTHNGGVVSGGIKKLREFFHDDMRQFTEDQIKDALKSSQGSKQNGFDNDDYAAVLKIIQKDDMIYVITENKYYYFSGTNHVPCDQSSYRKLYDELSGPNGAYLMDKVMRDEKRQYSHMEFSPYDYDRETDNIYNTKQLMIRKCLDVNLLDAEFIPEIDVLLESLSGECQISKTVHERWFVAHWYNTKHDNLMAQRPYFCYYGGKNGGGGAGRSLFWKDIMRIIYSPKYCASLNSKVANSDFNGSEENKRVILYNEMKKVDSEEFTEQSKDKEDSSITIHSKGKDSKDADNVAVYACSVNGAKFPIIFTGNHEGVDRRYLVSEGTEPLTKLLKKRGLIKADGGIELKYEARALVKSKILNKENIRKHLAYLYQKHVDWLEEHNWEVLGEETPAYQKQCQTQVSEWVTTHLVPYITNTVRPNAPKTITEIFEKYNNPVDPWFDTDDKFSKFKITKIDVFREKVQNALNAVGSLKGKWVYSEKGNKTLPDGGRTTVRDCVTITKASWADYLKEQESNKDASDGDDTDSFDIDDIDGINDTSDNESPFDRQIRETNAALTAGWKL